MELIKPCGLLNDLSNLVPCHLERSEAPAQVLRLSP